jgi:hypothetical protein
MLFGSVGNPSGSDEWPSEVVFLCNKLLLTARNHFRTRLKSLLVAKKNF